VNSRLPVWFKQKLPDPQAVDRMAFLLKKYSLHTICESAQCPNAGECFSKGTATFLILGDVCTRHCTFCAVSKGTPVPVTPEEVNRLRETIARLGLRYVVITSVTRDDLADGGAEHFTGVVKVLHEERPSILVEVLIPDFKGSSEALFKVVMVHPEVINHNVETVPRLYSEVRPAADYKRSLKLLAEVKKNSPRIITKSGLMAGLGETKDEIVDVMKDLRDAGCDLITIGQYLQPSAHHHPVRQYVTPEQFEEYSNIAIELGFLAVVAAPLVRSSYKAAAMYEKVRNIIDKANDAIDQVNVSKGVTK
jgi:lipoyl synthase